MRWAALAFACLALTGCETTQEKSAKLERAALATQRAEPARSAGLKIARPSRVIKVVSTAIVANSEGAAAVVVLRNDSATAQTQVPLAITVRGNGGSTVYTNTAPGLAPTLTAVALVPAHGQATWIDDQVQAASTPTSVTAQVGEGKPAHGAPPQIAIASSQLGEEPGGIPVLKGTVVNRSTLAQRELAVYSVLSVAGRVKAAGRAVLASLAPGASSPFAIYLIGSAPHGAHLELTVPPTVTGG
jgi:hypothetical protein